MLNCQAWQILTSQVSFRDPSQTFLPFSDIPIPIIPSSCPPISLKGFVWLLATFFYFKQRGLTQDTGRRQEKSILPGAELKVATGDLISSQHGNPLAPAQGPPRWKAPRPSPWSQWPWSSPFGVKHWVQLSRTSWRKLVGLCVFA